MDIVVISEERRNRLSNEQLAQLEQHASLLKTGGWGDCHVTCNGDPWWLHSDILCGRSGYFRAAFQGGFSEGQYHFLDLKEVVTAYFLKLVIIYIYLSIPAAGYDLEVFGAMSDDQFYGIVLELYRHAAYFQVEDLKIAIMRDLETRLDASARTLFHLQCMKDSELFKKAIHDPMTAALAAFDKSQVYYEYYEPIRAKLFAFVETCYPILCRCGDEFEDYLRAAPELGLAILKKMRNIEKSTFITPGPDARCMFCNAPVWEDIARQKSQPKFGITADVNGNVKYYCSRSECFRKISAKRCFNGN